LAKVAGRVIRVRSLTAALDRYLIDKGILAKNLEPVNLAKKQEDLK
jgi:hypothetical protein